MNNHAELRAALEAGPTPGPWTMDGTGTRALVRGADLTIVAVRHRLSGQAHEANARLIAAAHPEAIRALLAERDALIHDNSEYVSAANELATENQRLREALEASIEQMEYDAAKIDGEWGDCRSIDELERDGELPEALVLARAALAQEQEES